MIARQEAQEARECLIIDNILNRENISYHDMLHKMRRRTVQHSLSRISSNQVSTHLNAAKKKKAGHLSKIQI